MSFLEELAEFILHPSAFILPFRILHALHILKKGRSPDDN